MKMNDTIRSNKDESERLIECQSKPYQKMLSNLMLTAAFFSDLFYAMSYPYIYAETIKVVPKPYITFEQLFACIGTIIFCKLWNRYSDHLFKYYRTILIMEIIADVFLFADVIIRNDIKFYFLLNVIIYSTITRNLSCGGVKMRAMVNPTEKLRERYDNNNNVIASVSTILGASIALLIHCNLTTLFIFAVVGNTVDNFFYLYIYNRLRRLGNEIQNET